MDSEHSECAEALERLAKERTPAALDAVLRVYREHFAHEEELLDAHVFKRKTSGNDGFSADASMRTSHRGDHERLIRNLEAERQKGQPLSGAFISSVLRDFEAHAERYDGAYAESLSTPFKHCNHRLFPLRDFPARLLFDPHLFTRSRYDDV